MSEIAHLIHQGGDGIYFKVYVIPRARSLRLALENGELILYVNENCKHHSVNHAIIKYFTRIFRARVRILRGWSDRVKIIYVKDASKERAVYLLSSVLEEK